MRSIGLSCVLLLAVLTLTGCGQSGPKQVPIAKKADKVAEIPADEVETVKVDLDFEAETPADAPATDATSESDSADSGDTTAASENTPPTEADKPAEPQKPRPSVFLKLLTQPVQDAMQANMESVTEGTGGLLPSP